MSRITPNMLSQLRHYWYHGRLEGRGTYGAGGIHATFQALRRGGWIIEKVVGRRHKRVRLQVSNKGTKLLREKGMIR